MRKMFLFLLFLFPASSFANVFFGSPSLVTVTSSPQQVLPQNILRSYLIIVNTGSNTIFATFGTGLGNGIPIPAAGNYEPLKVPANSIYLNSPSGSSARVLQGQ